MINDLRASWALLIGIGFMMLGNGLQGTLLGLRATMEGFPTFITGIIMSGYFIGILVGSMIAPRLVERVGHIRVFAALASMASISILVHGIHVNPVSWTAMRFVTGLSYAGLYVVTESWLNYRASNETRGRVLSVYMVITTLGLGGGQFLLNLGDPKEIELFILVSMIASAGLIPILLTAKPAPGFGRTQKLSLKELYRASPLAVISSGLTGAAHGTIFGMGPVYAAHVLGRTDLVSIFMACVLLGGLVTQWPIGWLSDRINRRVTLSVLCLVAVLVCIAAMLLTKGSIAYFVIIVILGGAAIPLYSLNIAYANDRLRPNQIIAASGSLVMITGIGLSTGPIVVSFLMGQFGPVSFFIGIAFFLALILAFSTWRMGISEAIDPSDQSPAIATGFIGTPVAEYVAPDAEDYVEALLQDELHLLDEQSAADDSDENKTDQSPKQEAI